MTHPELQPARDALRDIQRMATRLIGANKAHGPVKPARLELAYTFQRIQHGEFMHWMRCEAADDALTLILDAIRSTLKDLHAPPERLRKALTFTEPYRHHLHPRVVAVALREAERAEVEREMKHWRGLRAVSADEPAAV